MSVSGLTGGLVVVDINALQLVTIVAVIGTRRVYAVFVTNHFPKLKTIISKNSFISTIFRYKP